MKLKRSIRLLLVCVLVISLLGCGIESQQDPTNGETIGKWEINTEQDIHIRDQNLLYANQDDTQIVTMYLTVSKGNAAEGTNHTWEEINTYSVYDYEQMGVDRYKVAGLLQVGNENGPVVGEFGYDQQAPNCTVQIRGQTSSNNTQKNYKISIKDNKGSWRGQTTSALNKHQTDGLRFRNKLAYTLLSEIDELMSLRTTFVRLYVKDTTKGDNAAFEDYGIYTQVEQLNKTALERHGLDKRGHLYKINFCEFFRYEDTIVLKNDPKYDVKKFEQILEIKGDDDHSKLIALLEKISDYTIPIETILNDHLDVENITYWMAFNILMGNCDSQNRNFYIYSPQNVDRWYIYPWDMDAMLKRPEYELDGRSDYGGWESGVSNYWGNVLFQRCLKSESFREELDKAVEDLYGRFTESYIMSRVNRYADLLRPLVYSGKDLTYAPLKPAEYDLMVSSIPEQIRDNYQRYQQSLKNPLPFYIGVPEKTESGYELQWDAAYDFNQEDITYSFELAADYLFENPIIKEENVVIPVMQLPQLAPGQYFIRVLATNESGLSQCAFDYYNIASGKVYGVKCFYVAADGSIVEDVYVEG